MQVSITNLAKNKVFYIYFICKFCKKDYLFLQKIQMEDKNMTISVAILACLAGIILGNTLYSWINKGFKWYYILAFLFYILCAIIVPIII